MTDPSDHVNALYPYLNKQPRDATSRDAAFVESVRQVHVVCYHILWDLTHTLLADHRGKLGATK